ncbi:hypothetical protein ACOSQ2_016651 [Xanthoceras sorbifolium]
MYSQELLDKVEAYEVMVDGAKVLLKIRAVDRYKRSSTFDAFMYREFANEMKESQSFLKDTVDKNALADLDAAIRENEQDMEQTMKKRRKLWFSHYRMKKLPILSWTCT